MRPAIWIGWDAAELSLVERLLDEGALPALSALRERGAFVRLGGGTVQYAGGVWPTFYTGKRVPFHGIFHNKLWRPERMRCEVASADWFSERPFWERLSGKRVAVLDVPMTVSAPRVPSGVQLAGWGTHDLIAKGAWPRSLWREARRRFGAPLFPPELFGAQSAKTLLELRRALLDATRQMGDLGCWLLRRERWDLFLGVLGAAHRGGHYLRDLSQIDAAEASGEERATLEGALVEIYLACDAVLGRWMDAAPADARVCVFALHGMGKNAGWSDLLPAICSRVQSGGAEAAPPKQGLLFRVKKAIPWTLARRVTRALPVWATNALVSLWSARMYDWKSTRWFPLPMDHAGYLRVNLAGREPEGIVQPGAEYEKLCGEIETALRGFRDLESGKPIVGEIVRAYRDAPDAAPHRALLPDLLVTWGEVSALDSKGVLSDRYGEIRWADPGRLPSGRCGNHSGWGWLCAAGEGIAPATGPAHAEIVDLLPTLLRWLDEEPAPGLQGRPIAPALPR